MSTPHVSVLIPTYNQAPFVGEALDSVLAQDYPDYEVLVSDDGSTDGTRAVLEDYARRHPDQIRLLGSERNVGISENFTRLVEASTGTYYAWLGGDDVMLPGKLSRQVELLERRPDAAGSVHDAEVFISETGETLGRFSLMYNGRPGFREGGAELWLRPWYYTLPSSMMIRRSMRPRDGYDLRLRFSNEWLFDVATFRNGPCVVLDDVLVRYRRHTGSVTSSGDHDRLALEENFIALGIIEARYPEYAALVRRRRTSLLFLQGMAALRAGDRGRARRGFAAAVADGGFLDVLRVGASFAGTGVRRRLHRAPVPR